MLNFNTRFKLKFLNVNNSLINNRKYLIVIKTNSVASGYFVITIKDSETFLLRGSKRLHLLLVGHTQSCPRIIKSNLVPRTRRVAGLEYDMLTDRGAVYT